MNPGPICLLLALLAGPPPAPAGDAARDGGPGLASRGRVQAINRMNEAIAAFEHNDVATAERVLREAIDLDPTYAQARLTLGSVYRKQGKQAAAAEVLKEALALPDLSQEVAADLAYDLGAVLMGLADEAPTVREQRARWTEAIVALDRAIAADPQRHKAHFRRALALDHLDRAAEADDAYRRCIALKSEYAPAYVSLAQLYLDYGRTETALRILKVGAEANPVDPAIQAGLSRVLFQSGRMKDAVAAAQEGLRRDPDAIDLWYSLGMALAELRERDKAIEALGRFLSKAGADTRPDLLRAARDTIARLQDSR